MLLGLAKRFGGDFLSFQDKKSPVCELCFSVAGAYDIQEQNKKDGEGEPIGEPLI